MSIISPVRMGGLGFSFLSYSESNFESHGVMQQKTALELNPQELLQPPLCSVTSGVLLSVPWPSVSSIQEGHGLHHRSAILLPVSHLTALHFCSDGERASSAEVRALSKDKAERLLEIARLPLQDLCWPFVCLAAADQEEGKSLQG